MIKRATTTTVSFSTIWFMRHRFHQPPPSPCYGLFHFRLTHICFYGNLSASPCLFFHFGLGQVWNTTDWLYLSPFSFLHLHQHIWFHDRSKSKAKQNTQKKKSKASEHNRLNCDFRSLIHFVLSFPFFASIFSILSPENMQKPMESVMGEQKLPWYGQPLLFSTLFSFLITEVQYLSVTHSLFPQFPILGHPLEWLSCKSFYYHFYNPFPAEMGSRKFLHDLRERKHMMIDPLHHSAPTKSKTNRAGIVMGARLFLFPRIVFPYVYFFSPSSFVFSVCVVFFLSVFVVLQLQFGHRINKVFVSCERNMTLLLWFLVLLCCGGRLIDIHPKPLLHVYTFYV